jgi:hexosaminidase
LDWYANDTDTQATLIALGKTFEQALSDFTVAEHGVLTKQGKTPVVWEEMVLDHNVTLNKDTIVMWVLLYSSEPNTQTPSSRVWISSADAAQVAEKGFRIVHAPSNYFYLVSRPQLLEFLVSYFVPPGLRCWRLAR